MMNLMIIECRFLIYVIMYVLKDYVFIVEICFLLKCIIKYFIFLIIKGDSF